MKKLDWKGVGQFVAVCVKLATIITSAFKKAQVSIEIMGWLAEDGKLFVVEACQKLAEAYKEAHPVVPPKKVLTVWKTLQIGGEPIAQVLTVIVDAGDEVSPNARFICEQSTFTVAREQQSVDFVKLTPADFGFTSAPRTDEFLTKEFLAKWSADHLDGYVVELCEAEDGPQLRRQYQDQPKGETLWMAMERLTGSGGGPNVFDVERRGDGLRWLRTAWVYRYVQWRLDDALVFRFRKVITQPSAA